MNTEEITLALMNNLFREANSEVIIPNCYVGRWEMDVLKLQRNFYLTEYEIKVSRSDFLNETKKQYKEVTYKKDVKGKYILERGKLKIEDIAVYNKLELIKNKQYVANKFYYVVPEGLIKPDELPPNTGLIYAINNGTSIYFKKIKTACFITKNKYFEDINKLFHLTVKSSMRENSWRIKYQKVKKKKLCKKKSFITK